MPHMSHIKTGWEDNLDKNIKGEWPKFPIFIIGFASGVLFMVIMPELVELTGGIIFLIPFILVSIAAIWYFIIKRIIGRRL